MRALQAISFATALLSQSLYASAQFDAFIDACGLKGQSTALRSVLNDFSPGIASNIVGFTLKELGSNLDPMTCEVTLRANADRLSRMIKSTNPNKTSIVQTPSKPKTNTNLTEPLDQSASASVDVFDKAFGTVRVEVDGIEAIFTGKEADTLSDIRFNNTTLAISTTGTWEHRTYLPERGLQVELMMVDQTGASDTREFLIERRSSSTATGVPELSPQLRDKQPGDHRVAIIIGVDQYNSLPTADFAEADAIHAYKMFTETFNIAPRNIKDLIGSTATEVNIKLAFRQWLASRLTPNKTELYIYYAGHGLTDEDGEKRYWMPYDSHAQLLEDTALDFTEILELVDSLSPKKTVIVTDSCYSGSSRAEQSLMAQRPIRVVRKLSALPKNTYLFAATQSHQTARAYGEAQHGLFSYWWLKGLEGGADLNADQVISTGELNEYTRTHVSRLSGGQQVPTFNGDPNEVVISW